MIQPSSPITIPAVAAQVADSLWITSFSVNAPSITGNIIVNAIVTPYSSVDGTMYSSLSKRVFIRDLNAVATSNPAIGLAMSGLYAGFQSYVTGQNIF